MSTILSVKSIVILIKVIKSSDYIKLKVLSIKVKSLKYCRSVTGAL